MSSARLPGVVKRQHRQDFLFGWIRRIRTIVETIPEADRIAHVQATSADVYDITRLVLCQSLILGLASAGRTCRSVAANHFRRTRRSV